jgi:hypothetical protein
VTVLGTQSPTAGEVVPTLDADIRAIEDFRRAWGNEAVIDAIEFVLPNVSTVESMRQGPAIIAKLRAAHLRGWVEIAASASWQDDILTIALQNMICEDDNCGPKLRCGGLTVGAFPGDEQVADFLHNCRSGKFPWKATAGLHHPRRHLDPSLNVWHHGFLNVFAAGVLASNHPLSVFSRADLVELLADRELHDLRFEPDRMTWKRWECSTQQIAKARANFATSFGSCSFDEPCDDLIAMGLLERGSTC